MTERGLARPKFIFDIEMEGSREKTNFLSFQNNYR